MPGGGPGWISKNKFFCIFPSTEGHSWSGRPLTDRLFSWSNTEFIELKLLKRLGQMLVQASKLLSDSNLCNWRFVL